jgi:membrane-bound lytic murein transglycosylase A
MTRSRRRFRTLPFVLIAAFGLAACADPPRSPTLILSPIAIADLPGWRDDTQGEAISALLRSCARLTRMADDDTDGILGTSADWAAPCAAAAAVGADDAAVRDFFMEWFTAFAATDGGAAEGMFTGYYEPELRGARREGGAYRHPLYGPPPDLSESDPYLSRAEIDTGALHGRGLEILWLDDPVDAFFLHVQGSGRVRLDSGEIIRAGFAGHNGHTYVAIGRVLVGEGELVLEEASLQSIRAWLRAHPARAADMMARNPRYIFFRELDGDGPIGAGGVALTPGRSLAVDRAYIPYGLPVWLDTTWPGTDRPLRRLVIAQDTGGAITGPVRGDLFWGAGAEAEDQAGHMREGGRYYLLLPRTVAARRLSTS